MHLFASLALLWPLAFSSPPAAAVDQRVEYYDIAGSSAQELRRALDRLRPTNSKGERFDAYTKWNVSWRYRYVMGETTCALQEFGTSVRIVVVLPRWSSRQASSRLVDQWVRYIQALSEHENGHVAIGLRAATLVQKEVAALEPAPTCPILERAIEAKGAAILDQFRTEEAQYDDLTRHGATQGAVFP